MILRVIYFASLQITLIKAPVTKGSHIILMSLYVTNHLSWLYCIGITLFLYP